MQDHLKTIISIQFMAIHISRDNTLEMSRTDMKVSKTTPSERISTHYDEILHDLRLHLPRQCVTRPCCIVSVLLL